MRESVVLPAPGSSLGVGSWWRDLRALAAVAFKPPPYPRDRLPRGDGRTVMTIPGFLAGDWTMLRLRTFLEGLGYRVEASGIVFNAGPTAQSLVALDAALLRIAESHGVCRLLNNVMARELA